MKRIVIALSMVVLLVSPLSAAPPAANPPAVAPQGEWGTVDPATYSPQFSTAKSENGHDWILDHGQRVAIFRGCMIGLFRQYPGQVIDEQKVAADEAANTWFMLPGLRLWTQFMMTAHIGPTYYMDGSKQEIQWDTSKPGELTIHLSWTKNPEEVGTQDVTVNYDRQLQRYVVHVTADLKLNQPGGGEYCNFYANGLGDLRPGHNRYDRLVYQDADEGGKLKAHFLSVQVFQPGPIHLPANGLFGFVDEKDGNPVVVVEESTPRTRVDMCLCWYDAHFFFDEARQVNRADKTKTTWTPAVAGPPYRYHVKFKAYWLNPGESTAMLAQAQTVSLAPFADKFAKVVPVDMNVVNDFEHLADYASGKVKHFYVPLSDSLGVSYDTAAGHSGHCSVRFASKSDKGIAQHITGPEMLVTPGRQVKVSAWVKTAGVTGEGFYLESGFSDNGEQIGPKYQSAKLTGTHDWTLLELPLPVTPPHTQFMGRQKVSLCLTGKGTAWVDDFVFAEQDAGGPPVAGSSTASKP